MKAWWSQLTLRRVRLEDVLPVAPRYIPLLKEVTFLPEDPGHRHDVDIYVNVILRLLADVPGAYLGFRHINPNTIGAPTHCGVCEPDVAYPEIEDDGDKRFVMSRYTKPSHRAEFFAGWSSTACPAWASRQGEPVASLNIHTKSLITLILQLQMRMIERWWPRWSQNGIQARHNGSFTR